MSPITDSWSVASGLASWLPTWVAKDWKIYSKTVWGKAIWKDICELVQRTKVTVFHVDAHSNINSLGHLYNSVTANQAKISQAGLEFPQEGDHEGLAKWAHHKCGHLGEKATYKWAQERGIAMSLDMIRTIIAQCPVCQHTHKCLVPNIVKGELGRGKLPGQIWWVDNIGPLSQDQGCKYICTGVDTYSGYLIAYPCRKPRTIVLPLPQI
uniref:Integrase catalytic domain-containing protein n=1 Tax=Athene cunicularia TaxID=194338 RepID=A0A663MWX4_ATHCN